jgi:phage host-nuclease inhibitor protein Gam
MNHDQIASKMKVRIDEWNATIHRVEAEMHKKSGETADEYKKQLAEMKRLRDEGARRMEAMRKGGCSAIEDAARKAGKAWSDIVDGVSKAAPHVK